MTDRELIEAAAKAAGLWDYREQCIDIPWNPLNDDGDALRLAVKLKFLVESDEHCMVRVIDGYGEYEDGTSIVDFKGNEIAVELHGSDPYAATRRAIVRAAASCSTHHV